MFCFRRGVKSGRGGFGGCADERTRDRATLHACSCRSMPVNAGRGLNPRPERSTPAKYLPVIPNPERHLHCCSCCRRAAIRVKIFVFRLSFPCFRVGGSFRSGVQPPTGINPPASGPALLGYNSFFPRTRHCLECSLNFFCLSRCFLRRGLPRRGMSPSPRNAARRGFGLRRSGRGLSLSPSGRWSIGCSDSKIRPALFWTC